MAEGPPLSLRPFPVGDKSPKHLADFIARVNALPGGFRDVTEAKLRDEMAARADPDAASDDDVSMDEGDEDDEDSANRDPAQARLNVLRNLDIAGNNAMLTLDSLSLLMSKQNPTQAGVTLSQQLREMVGIGTLGSDKLHDSRTSPDKVKDDAEVALGWTLMGINKARDAAADASKLLDAEIDAEGKYWEGVLAVKKAGWSICKLPNERHTLGVRFGFSEAAPEFKINGLAAMRRAEDGTVDLDTGRLGRVQERIVVTFEHEGQSASRSTLHKPPASTSETSLEERVLSARNTIFAQELWGELVREARALAAYDVRPVDKKLTCELEPGSRLVIELAPTGTLQDDVVGDGTAEAVSAALHVLLTYAHRCNELFRIRPKPPHIPRSRGTQTYTLLRPIIARIMSGRSTAACVESVGQLTTSLARAGLPASFTLRTTPTSTGSVTDQSNFGANALASSVTIIRNILQPIDFSVDVTLLPNIEFTLRGRTYLFPVTATYYHVLAPPESPVHKICAPYQEGYPDAKALGDYLRTLTERALALHCLEKMPDKEKWTTNLEGTSIRDADGVKLDVGFVIKGDTVVLTRTPLEGDGETKTWTWAAETTSVPLVEAFGEAINEKLVI